jgi:fatty acid desaturase
MPNAPAAPAIPAAPPPTETVTADAFGPLLRQIKGEGLLARRTGWYAAGITLNVLVLAALAGGMLAFGGSWWVLVLAVPLAVFSARTGFFGHDAGHSQIAESRRTNRLLGLFHGNLLLGMSSAWWNDKHNRHHANPNHVDKDPDVGEGVLVWTEAQAAKRAGAARWLSRNQAWLFFPLLLLEGIALKASSVQMVVSSAGWDRQGRGARATEAALLVLHYVAYVALLAVAMSPGKAIAFAAIHQALFGLHLGSVFAPNHKGMEMPDSDGERWGHLRRQVLTSRNVRGGPLTDWFMGGLNYQIEHHLFPSMPRPHLRRAQPMIRQYCLEAGVSYAETGLVDSYRQALRHMYDVAAPLR